MVWYPINVCIMMQSFQASPDKFSVEGRITCDIDACVEHFARLDFQVYVYLAEGLDAWTPITPFNII